jgi:methyl-accepting chemotaxis protein
MKISKKLFYLNLGLILTLVLLCVVNVIAVQREHAAQAAAAKATQAAKLGEEIRYQLMQNRLRLGSYLLSGDERELQAVEIGAVKLQSELHAAQENALNDVQRASLNRLRNNEHEWEESFLRPVVAKRKDVDNGKTTVADLQIFYLQLNPNQWTHTSADYLDEAETTTARLVADQHMQDASAGNVTIMVALLGTCLAILFGFGVSYKTALSITVPLEQLIRASREIGETGDLDHEIDSRRKDEIGELARTFSTMVSYLKGMAATSEAIAGGNLAVEVNPLSPQDTLGHAFARMVEGLRSLVGNVRDSAAQVASGSTQVAGASDESARISVQASSAIDEVTSTMHEMSINVQNMVKNTQVQGSSVNETSASIDQMVASIQRVADTAKVLLDISERSRLEVHNGIATMDKATDGLTRINRTIQVSGGIIDSLGQRADDIGKIVGVIDDLAEQTNLLALNAAIEAARAGEHGLGFAVVAEEVRKLAEKSAQSTKEISELISSIQREARKAVENMEKSTAIVNEGLTMGTDLNTALKKISSVVTEVYKFAQEIGAATNEQSHGSSQIARATAQLNEITCEINSAVEEQASGAQAVVKAMEKMRELVQRSTSGSAELAASAEQMSKMSRSLLESMDRFAIDAKAQTSGNGAKRLRTHEEEYIQVSRYTAPARS